MRTVDEPLAAVPARRPRSVLYRLQPSACRGDRLSPTNRQARRFDGVYLVTSPQRPVSRMAATVAAALEGGVSFVQLRDKGTYSAEERTEAGAGLREPCRRRRRGLCNHGRPGSQTGRRGDSPRLRRGSGVLRRDPRAREENARAKDPSQGNIQRQTIK